MIQTINSKIMVSTMSLLKTRKNINTKQGRWNEILVFNKQFQRETYRPVSGPVAPLFVDAVSIHYFQQSDHLYLSAHREPTR